MSRFSTPSRKSRDAYCIHPDDKQYHMKINEFTKAPRRMKNMEAHHIRQQNIPKEIALPYHGDLTPLPSFSVPRSFEVTRQRLQGYDQYSEGTNQTGEIRFVHADDPESASSEASTRINAIDSRDEAPMTYQKCDSYKSKCLYAPTDADTKSPIADHFSHFIFDGAEETRDQIEQARFDISEDSSRDENFPFDEIKTKTDSPPPSIFRQRSDPLLLSTRSHPSSTTSRNRTLPTYEHSDTTFRSDNTLVLMYPSSLSSPPRVTRISSPKAKFDLLSNSNISPNDRMDRIAYPMQKREVENKQNAKFLNRIPLSFHYHIIVGPTSMNIHRLRLPDKYLNLLDKIVHGCEVHARGLSSGWHTNLYSLTKQDIAVREVPYLYQLSKPILSYMSQVACALYGVTKLTCDNNQPHVLKYTEHHTGVEFHHDKCDITMNLMMSRSNDYIGGGTYFPAAKTNVRLEFGEFLLHPGQEVHGGTDIHSGTRILMVAFANSSQ